jgi:hypothetical protein
LLETVAMIYFSTLILGCKKSYLNREEVASSNPSIHSWKVNNNKMTCRSWDLEDLHNQGRAVAPRQETLHKWEMNRKCEDWCRLIYTKEISGTECWAQMNIGYYITSSDSYHFWSTKYRKSRLAEEKKLNPNPNFWGISSQFMLSFSFVWALFWPIGLCCTYSFDKFDLL